MAELHPRLQADTRAVGETPSFWIRYMNDRRFAWLVIVPRVAGVTEWHELPSEQQHELLDLVNRCALHLKTLASADKINVGALGNMVAQLHVHVIARHQGDPCWPGPVWGNGTPEPWSPEQAPPWLNSLREKLSYRCA